MDDFTLTDKNFCELVKSIHINRNVTHIKVKGHGNSMAPFLKTGEILFIRPVHLKELIRIGDIIALTDKKEEKIIIHRVINKKNHLFEIKGDNCKHSDGWFHKKKIIGVVTRKTNLSGKIISFRRWENLLIAVLSKTDLLNYIVLPFGRSVKKKLKDHKK